MEEKKNTNIIYLIGGVAGALLGVTIAHVLVRSSESKNKPIQLSAQQGLQIGLQTAGFARALLNLLNKS
ncbi:MAG TPA: hypothetical protein PLL88_04885 [Anaerolineaceae bacterium]|nr:hypothetical protein [Anaerolineaceae bacterium]